MYTRFVRIKIFSFYKNCIHLFHNEYKNSDFSPLISPFFLLQITEETMLEPFVLRPPLYNLVRSTGTREKEREASLFPIDKSSAQSDRSSPRVDDLKTGPYRGTIRRMERLGSNGSQVRLYLVNVCPPLTFPELSKTVNVCSANYVTPSNCFTKQVGECAFTRRYIYIYIYMAHEPTTKDPGPLQISFRLFDYLTDATIKSSPIIGDSPVYFSRCPAVPLGNHGSFVFLRPPRFISLPYDFSRSLDTLDFP